MTQELNKEGLEVALQVYMDGGLDAFEEAIQAYLNHTKARKAQRGRNI